VCRSYLLLKLHAAEIALHYLDAYSLSNDWLIAADHFMKPHDAILRRLLYLALPGGLAFISWSSSRFAALPPVAGLRCAGVVYRSPLRFSAREVLRSGPQGCPDRTSGSCARLQQAPWPDRQEHRGRDPR
jgi:hypothetical protein